jgi:hypothetical protein
MEAEFFSRQPPQSTAPRRQRPQSAPLIRSQSAASGSYGPGSKCWADMVATRGSPGCGGHPAQARRPFTAIPGYSGYIPRKVPDSILGCSFTRANARARGAMLGES